MDKFRLVKIEWVDSVGVGQWRTFRNTVDENHICISVGYLVKDGENVKKIVPHLSPKNTEFGTSEYGCGDMIIPCVAIVSMVDLIPKTKSRRRKL